MAEEKTEAWGVRETADYLRVHEGTVKKWVRKGTLPCIRKGKPGKGNGTLIDPAVLDQWLKARAVQTEEGHKEKPAP